MATRAGAAVPETSGGAPTARRMVLGAQLRKLREAAGITRAEAGYSIRGSESKISRLELGRVGFKKRDVEDLLTMYGVSDPLDRMAFLDLVEQSNQPGWWYNYNDSMPSWMSDYVGLEESATRIQTFELQFVPGLLQTEEYARVVAGRGCPKQVTEADERRIQLRMRRQRVLTKPNPAKFWAFLDEAVLHRTIGGPDVMKRQLGALLDWTSLPHITVQVLPYSRSAHSAEGAFAVLRFAEPELPDVAYVEYLTGAVYLDKIDEIEPYGRAIDRLAVDAEPPEQSRAMIDKLRSSI